ncbi:MAG: HNH endonuclease [Planctomycetia bacterium]|jgi:5-methylcytosine-specific restriction endonuclease McrA
MDARLRTEVRGRASGRCEYCRIREDQDPFFTFPIDHVVAKQHGGLETLDNLCLSCFRCNAHKGPNLTSVDPQTGRTVPLFHPRRDT